MTDRPTATDGGHQRTPGGTSYFASLEAARYMLLTTFKREGTPVSAPVQGVVDGDRAYIRAWSRSGTVKRLRHIRLVQAAPCTALGLYSCAPPVYATARLLPGAESGRIAGKLARKYPARRRFPLRLLHRTGRRRMVHYELLAHEAAGDADRSAG